VDIDEIERRTVAAAKRGDTRAFGDLVQRYVRRVISIAWGIVRDSGTAEDLAQDAFVRAWERIESFDESRAFGPWIFTIVTRMSLDVARRKGRFPEDPIDRIDNGSFAAGPDRLAESNEIRHRIDEAIESLPGMQRVVARLWLVEQFDHAEIAEMTGLSEGTIRSHLSHARSKLREKLENLR